MSSQRQNEEINFDFDCNSQYVIYLITWKTCQSQYLGTYTGTTTTPLRKRF